MDEDHIFYVYILFRPWNGTPCYVGKGKGDRWLDHEREGERHRNRHMANIIKKAGGRLGRVKAAEGLTEAQAFAMESALIAAIGRKAHGGPLVNQTDGGDGPTGYRHTTETKELVGRLGLGRKHTEESRAKMSATRTGMKYSEEAKANMSAAQKGRVITAEARAKISATLKGRGPPPEHMARLAEISRNREHRRGHKLTDDHRAKIGASHLGQKRSAEACAKMAKTWLGRKHTEETKAKMVIAAQARCARKSAMGAK